MNLTEFKKVEKLKYFKYVEYLQKKYGIPSKNYMNANFNKNAGLSRTSEGLFVHHVMECKAIMLSNPLYAKNNPYEYQLVKNLVYCDYLEHLFLHILICEDVKFYKKRYHEDEIVGIGEIVDFLIPELNDIYSGWIPKQEWKRCCINEIIKNKKLYLILVKRFFVNCDGGPYSCYFFYKDSYNAQFNTGWKIENNEEIFKEITNMIKSEVKVWCPHYKCYCRL